MRLSTRSGLLVAVLAMMACTPVGAGLRVTARPDAPVASVPPGTLASRPPAPPSLQPTPVPESSLGETADASGEAVPLEPASPVPTGSPVTLQAVDESAWVEKLRADFPTRAVSGLDAISLNRQADVPVTQAIGFNVPASHAPTGFVWEAGDREADEWMPQGIGGFTSGGPDGRERDGRRWLVVTWYAKDAQEDTTDPTQALSYRGSRLSLIDVTDPQNIRYRHMLLVQDAAQVGSKELFRMRSVAKAGYHQGDRFAPVPIHAGGVEVYGHWVYVVDTQLGLRVFDLDRVFTADANPARYDCGLVDGLFEAFDYRFILPEVAHYKITGAAPYSCLSLDESHMTLWLGQYLAEDAAARSAVTGIPLGTDGRLGAQTHAITFPKDNDGSYAHRVQGVFRRGDETWMSITGQDRYEGSTARLALYKDGAATGFRWRWPQGAEDLYYEAPHDTLWCLTEDAKSLLTQRDRCVFGVKLSSYNTP